MRLIYLLFGLAAILWLTYTYTGSDTAHKQDADNTVKQQAAERLDEARAAADALQKSLDEQAKRLPQANE
ncbi:MAG: hypothetical protein R6X06_02010 [Gammaproteobacteria bacterium]